MPDGDLSAYTPVTRTAYHGLVLERLRRLDKQRKLDRTIINITGIYGIGKTELARQLFQQSSQQYPVVLIDFTKPKSNAQDIEHNAWQQVVNILHRIPYLEDLSELPPSPDDEERLSDTFSISIKSSLDRVHYKPLLLILDGLEGFEYWRWVQGNIIKPLVERGRAIVVCLSSSPIFLHFWELRQRADPEPTPLHPFLLNETLNYLSPSHDPSILQRIHEITAGYPLAIRHVLDLLRDSNKTTLHNYQGERHDSFELLNDEIIQRSIHNLFSEIADRHRSAYNLYSLDLSEHFEKIVDCIITLVEPFTAADLQNVFNKRRDSPQIRQGHALDIISILVNQGLVYSNSQEGYYLNPLIRHLLVPINHQSRRITIKETQYELEYRGDGMKSYQRVRYVGRIDQQTALLRASKYIISGDKAIAVILSAPGGLGKTALLELYPEIVRRDFASIGVARIIDMYNAENRQPDEIERKLIDGLRQVNPEQWYRVPPEIIDNAFAAYTQAYRSYNLARESGANLASRSSLHFVRQSFIDCWNSLAVQIPLVMRFDTVETLTPNIFDTSPFKSLQGIEEFSGASLVIDWIKMVLPHLKHTLIIFSGRPSPQLELLKRSLSEFNLLFVEEQLRPFQDPDEIRSFFKDPSSINIQHVLDVTEGQPLLITCYAATRQRDIPLPPGFEERLLACKDRMSFEQLLADKLFNTEEVGADIPARTLIHSLYFLACGRRGLRVEDLQLLFDKVALRKSDQIIDQLERLALVKPMRDWNEVVVAEGRVGKSEQGPLLFLHDKLNEIIERSGNLQRSKLYGTTHHELSARSAWQVREANNTSDLLRAMSNHVYYALTWDFTTGYRAYTMYIDRLLRDRNVDEARILADDFRSILNTKEIVHGRPIHPYQKRLLESQVTEEEISRDEMVRHIKLLRARDEKQAALAKVEESYIDFVDQGWIIDDTTKINDQFSSNFDPYLFVDFSIVRAQVMRESGVLANERLASDIFSRIIEFLEQPHAINDELLILRRLYFLGEAYTLRGYMRRQQSRYKNAVDDTRQGLRAYEQYQQDAAKRLNDQIDSEIGQVLNNLAYNLVQVGRFEDALSYSNQLLSTYISTASSYRRALWYNARALIYIRHGEYQKAEEPLAQAEQEAQASLNQRAKGLVIWSRAQVVREEMNAQQDPAVSARNYYFQAASALQHEANTLDEVYGSWARYERDAATLFYKRGDKDGADDCARLALGLCNNLRERLPPTSSMRRADVQQIEASVYLLLGDIQQAINLLDSAEELMHNRMQEFGQVVAARIAFQRGSALIELSQPYNALRYFTVAIARAYVFGNQHRDLLTLERLVSQRLGSVSHEILQAFLLKLEQGEEHVSVDKLLYQLPHHTTWERAWEASIQSVQRLILKVMSLETAH